MDQTQLTALIGFAFVTSVTPGPNNMMLLASGANFGFRASRAHMFGISFGHSIMVVLLGLGLAGLLEAFPVVLNMLKIACLGYLLYLAWKIATAAAPKEGEVKGKPLTSLQAAAFQWVNPKAWAMALSAVTLYAPSQEFPIILLVALVFFSTNLPSVSLWAYAGSQLRIWLSDPFRLRVFNGVMAVLLVASTYPFLLR